MNTTTLHLLGKIIRLQIQPSALTLGERPNRYYDPAALLAVNELILTRNGAAARLPGGELVLDIHNAEHPQNLNDEGENDLSINFTSHYDAIRAKFGASDRLFNGCGGENILIETGEPIPLETVRGGVAVRTQAGGIAWLRQVIVARPCNPFTHYAARQTEPESIKAALQFLDNGRRGFYCGLEHGEATVRVGDAVFVNQNLTGL